MTQFQAISPNAEVNGETVLSIVAGMGAFKHKALELLAAAGIPDPAPGKWYRQQSWLDAFKAIADSVGANTLFVIGQKIPENAQFPPQIDSLEAALGAIDVAYHMNHRHGEIGHYHFRKLAERDLQVVGDNPYPCDFDRGIVAAMAKRFRPADSKYLEIAHDEKAPCRKKGASSCTYRVTW